MKTYLNIPDLLLDIRNHMGFKNHMKGFSGNILNVNRSTYSRWENGTRPISSEILKSLPKLLNVPRLVIALLANRIPIDYDIQTRQYKIWSNDPGPFNLETLNRYYTTDIEPDFKIKPNTDERFSGNIKRLLKENFNISNLTTEDLCRSSRLLPEFNFNLDDEDGQLNGCLVSLPITEQFYSKNFMGHFNSPYFMNSFNLVTDIKLGSSKILLLYIFYACTTSISYFLILKFFSHIKNNPHLFSKEDRLVFETFTEADIEICNEFGFKRKILSKENSKQLFSKKSVCYDLQFGEIPILKDILT